MESGSSASSIASRSGSDVKNTNTSPKSPGSTLQHEPGTPKTVPAALSAHGTTNATNPVASNSAFSSNRHPGSLASLGDACGVAFLLGNHAKFGLAERCCYHFDLIETLTSLPSGRSLQSRVKRRERGLSESSHGGGSGVGSVSGGGGISSKDSKESNEGGAQSLHRGHSKTKYASSNSSSNSTESDHNHCYCGVVSLLECVPTATSSSGGGGISSGGGGSVGGGAQPDRSTKRILRSKHREFNNKAQGAWGRGARRVTSKSGGKRQGRFRNSGSSGSGVAGSNSATAAGAASNSADAAGGGGAPRRCHQPRHLPLPLNPNTRVSFAYELTSIALVVDASPSITATFGNANMIGSPYVREEGGIGSINPNQPQMMGDGYCVPLDRLGNILKTYLEGLVKPIDVPPVAVSGLGVAFGRWTPNLAVTVVAAYPPTPKGDRASAGLLVRDYRVSDEQSALELAYQIERWALSEVEGTIAERLCGERSFYGDGVAGRKIPSDENSWTLSSLGPFSLPPVQHVGSWTRTKSSMKDLLAVGDAALATLPPEGRPILLVATDCRNVICGGIFETLAETFRNDVPMSVLDLSGLGAQHVVSTVGQMPSSQLGVDFTASEYLSYPLSMSDDHQSLREACTHSGGIFLYPTLLDACVNAIAGSVLPSHSPLYGDFHFSFKRRSISPNALQWYTLFSLSPFTPGWASTLMARQVGNVGSSRGFMKHATGRTTARHFQHQSVGSLGTFNSYMRQISEMSPEPSIQSSLFDSGRSKHLSSRDAVLGSGLDEKFSPHANAYHERTVFSKYNVQPVRIKTLLMTRVLEGYRTRRYGHNTQDPDKVSIHMTLRLSDCGLILHYEVSFVSSPYHVPTVGTAHIKLELSGEDLDFIQVVKKTFISHGADIAQQGRRVPSVSKFAAERICKLLRWIRKEDYLESYLCLPGWGDINHFANGSSFLRRLESLTALQRYRHFRSETFEAVTFGGNPFENQESLFSDMEAPEDEMFSVLSNWTTGVISEHKLYFREIYSEDDDLAYYCIVRVLQSPSVSRLFTFTLDFHGEMDADHRLKILSSLRESLKGCTNVMILSKCISENIAIRPSSKRLWCPCWPEYFLHHKSWHLIKDPEVLPLITKRRNQIGNFFILHAEHDCVVFAKFVQVEATSQVDVVIYQVLSSSDGIFVDIHMESTRGIFYPFYSQSTTFCSIYEKIKSRDKDCAKNLRSRTNLLAALDHSICNAVQFDHNEMRQADDVLRLLRVSTRTKKKLRFFHQSDSANSILYNMTTSLMTLESFKTKVARLSIGPDQLIGKHCGTWFIMRVDWYVLSVVHFSLRDNLVGDSLVTYRNLNFFTVGIMDLYQSDDELENIEYNSDVDSEHFGVSEIAHSIEASHGRNFSRALYLSLRDSTSPNILLQGDDIDYALKFCIFKEVLQSFISMDDLSGQLSSIAETMTGRKLLDVIENTVNLLPGSKDTFYFNGDEVDLAENIQDSDIESVEGDLLPDYENENQLEKSESDDVDDIQSMDGEEKMPSSPESDTPPIFFRFDLDKKAASTDDIKALKKSCILSVHVSLFEESENVLPSLHSNVVLKLRRALNAFSSEQTLEKFRFFGDALSHDDFKIIMHNLHQTSHYSFDIPLVFFVSRSGSLVPASNPTGSNQSDLDHGFSVLLAELEKSENTLKAGYDSYLVLDDSASREVLPYWSFFQVRKARGSIVGRIHHPHGNKAAEELSEIVGGLVKDICHRANQLLLLESLHKTKHASNLLIPEESPGDNVKSDQLYSGSDVLSADEPQCVPGYFSCPIQYRELFPLNHRCAPKQAVISLDSVLQNFLVSNRRIAVVRDESSNIFYMRLNCFKEPDTEEGDQNPHTVELLVYGLDNPGPSITEQLVRLLQKKLLLLPLEALSSVLKKNPCYQLLPADLAFIENFSQTWRELDNEGMHNLPRTRVYDLPPQVQDPLILLLMFRQNICGSTFIQHLHESSEDKSHLSDVLLMNDSDGTISVKFLPSEFLFYFNSTPSQLDPNYQPETTLTEKGRLFSRQAGSGIAIIQVKLLLDNCCDVDKICVGKAGDFNSKLKVSKSDVSIYPSNTVNEHKERNNGFKLAVNITNTTVDTSILHNWIELSLSQVLVAWSIERLLEKSRNSSCKDIRNEVQMDLNVYEAVKRKRLDSSLPGLPVLEDMMNIAVSLPHPTIVKIQSKMKMVKATSLGFLTLELMEKAILGCIFNQQSTPMPFEGVDIVRYEDSESKAFPVSITRDHVAKKSVRVENVHCRKLVKDKATDCPEYVCVFGLKGTPGIKKNHLFFKEIFIDKPTSSDGTNVFSQALLKIKQKKSHLFQRSLVIILTVTRTTRTLLTYNVSPDILGRMKTRFMEIEDETTDVNDSHRCLLRNRCFQHLSFQREDATRMKKNGAKSSRNASQPDTRQISDVASTKQPDKIAPKDEAAVHRGPIRRIPRPTSMLRPKLIGKSVEGSAMQAVAASRLRASARPTPPHRSSSGSSQHTTNVAPQRVQKERKKEKAGPSDRRSSGAQKKRDSLSVKDNAVFAKSVIGSPLPSTNLVQTYQDFISTLKKGPEVTFMTRKHLNPSVLHSLAQMISTSLHDKSASFMLMRVMCMCYGFFLGSRSVRQLPCDDTISSAHSFFDFILKSWKAKGIARIDGKPDPETFSTSSRFAFLRKELVANASHSASVVLEVSIPFDNNSGAYIFKFSAWLIISSIQEKGQKSGKLCEDLSKKSYLPGGNIEWKAAAIESIARDFFNRLRPEVELFNYSGSRLVCDAQRESGKEEDVLSLLRSTIARFPSDPQSREGLMFKIQRRFLSPSSFLNEPLLQSCKNETMINHFKSSSRLYNLTECHGFKGNCFLGKTRVSGYLVYYFIAWHESVQMALEIFTLSMTKGEFVDHYITTEGSGYAEKLSDVILCHSMTTVQKLIKSAAEEIRKHLVWSSFGKEYSFCKVSDSCLIRDISELRSVAYQIDIDYVDKRLYSLLYEDANDIEIKWWEVFSLIEKSSSFSHCVSFCEGSTSNYILYCKESDVFLDFVMDGSCKFLKARAMTRDKISYSEDKSSLQNFSFSVRNTVQEFITFVLKWMWSDIEPC